jgi:hypothetical protein
LIFLVVVALVLGLISWLLLDDSLVRVESGKLGLLMKGGKATDKTLVPGLHFVAVFRRRVVETYPAVELSYRAGGGEGAVTPDSDLERSGPRLSAVLGDRTEVQVAYTVRFRLDPADLRGVHERFGPDGLWAAVRDLSSREVRTALSADGCGVDDLFGPARQALEERLGDALTTALGADGLTVVLFALGDVDLGRTGELIQAAGRARFGLAREEAEAATRVAQARNDVALETELAGSGNETALRYREVDAWQDVALSLVAAKAVLPGPVTRLSASPEEAAEPAPAEADDATTP